MGTLCQPTEPHEHLWPWEGRHGWSWWHLAANQGSKWRWESAPAAPPAPLLTSGHPTGPQHQEMLQGLASRAEESHPALVLPTLTKFCGLHGPNWNQQLGGSRGPCVELGGDESERGWAEPGAQVRSPLRNRCPEGFLCFFFARSLREKGCCFLQLLRVDENKESIFLNTELIFKWPKRDFLSAPK